MDLLQEERKVKMGESDEVSVHPKVPKSGSQHFTTEKTINRYIRRFE